MHSTDLQTYSPAVKSFIPLLYVAWADGLLSPSEVKIIKREINKAGYLKDEEKDLLLKWADPSEWPDEQTFKEWMQLMKDTDKNVDFKHTDSIVELGIAMSEKAQVGHAPVDTSVIRASLDTLQEKLHVPPPSKFRALSGKTVSSPPDENLSKALQVILEDDSHPVKERMRKLLTDPAFERKLFRDKDDHRAKILEWVKLLADQGYGAIGYPAEYGGEGHITNYASIFEIMAQLDMSLAVKFGVQFGLFGGSVHHLGTAHHHNKYLLDIGAGRLLGCFAMTETGHGSNVRDLETTATYDHTTGLIDVHSPTESAGKEFIGNALHGRMATVFAQLIINGDSKGVHAILVPLRDKDHKLLPGIRIEDNGYKLGLNGIDNGRIWFDHVKVPRENLLNKYGNIRENGEYESSISKPSKRFFTMVGTLVGGRLCVAKGALNASKSALTIAIKYGLQRRQFGADGDPVDMLIMDYPSHQRRLLPYLAATVACDFALHALIKRYDQRQDGDLRIIETQAAALKVYATAMTTSSVQECREACGGKGYLMENRLADLKADSDIFTTFEGDNTVLLQLVAKGLLSRFKNEFNDAGFLGIVRYLRTQMSDSALKLNPIYKRKTDADHLKDPAFHLHAFKYRERKLLFSLGSRVQSMFRKRITPYDVFLRTQNHMIELARAYTELIILEEFQAKLSTIDHGLENTILTDLYLLYALHTIEKNKGWYLEQDYLEYSKTKAIRRMVDRTCASVRQNCQVIVDAFGIPNSLLGAPIAIS